MDKSKDDDKIWQQMIEAQKRLSVICKNSKPSVVYFLDNNEECEVDNEI